MATYTNTKSVKGDPPSKENKRKIFFRRASDFYANLKCEFSDDLKGLRNWFAMMHTLEGMNRSLYNNWNFTSTKYWDNQ